MALRLCLLFSAAHCVSSGVERSSSRLLRGSPGQLQVEDPSSALADDDDFSRFYNVSEFSRYIIETKGGNASFLLRPFDQRALANDYGHLDNASVPLPAVATSPNLCIGGKLVPSFYLIGAQKCATSSFAEEFASSPNVVVPEAGDWTHKERMLFSKELHFFDQAERYKRGRAFWLSHWPSCPKYHAVAADFTPSYLSSWEAPERLKASYGPQASQVTFLVILREPLSRMQSSFYHGKSSGFVNSQYASFEQYVQSAIQKYRSKAYRKFHDTSWDGGPKMDFYSINSVPFTLSLYSEQLAHWLAYFQPAQFVIAPMRAYTRTIDKGEQRDLVRTVASRPNLQASFPWKQRPKPKPHVNVHAHPTIETDLHPSTLAQMRAIFEDSTGPAKLASLLGPAMSKGLELYGYHGAKQDLPSIAKYISANW